ncbi:tachykinin-like peptides receptor 86C [Eurytemora carolleeae]|uniref:tachykinin-like peptides receptor 86C n=1 Tax=Eurytemora carolleeae TaxID=1294199 RepID=UPI000C77F02F|nr:tachykinin-like peptides receptor 86C [Eurytemora carolleeae]|eukprot:XP_023336238.1 tachykinin-like peptides receptor 86C [Eurytemora affinis]
MEFINLKVPSSVYFGGRRYRFGYNWNSSNDVWTYGQILWTLMFSIIIVVAILGNTIVIWIILAHRRMWSVTNYFLFNLTLADLMMATLNCIPSFIFMRDRVWTLGYIYCKINTFLSYVTIPASVFTLLAITIDRRKAIVRPLEPKTSRMKVLITILVIWILSSIISLPPTLVAKHFLHGRCGKNYICVPIWPSTESIDASQYDHVYNILFSVITYLTPMIGMGICYKQIWKNLWGGECIGEIMVHPAVLKSRQNKKRVVIMFAVVISIFMVCWLPYQLYFIFLYYIPSVKYFRYIGDLYLSFYWLAMANSCVNPIIYYWMNSRFREYFNSVLFCLPRCFYWIKARSLRYKDDQNQETPKMLRLCEERDTVKSRKGERPRLLLKSSTKEAFLGDTPLCELHPVFSISLRESREPRELGESRQSRESREPKEPREPKEFTESREPRKPFLHQETGILEPEILPATEVLL